MRALIYLLKRTTINSIKELRHSPLKLILYVLIIPGIIFALVFGSKSNVGFVEQQLELFRAIFLGITLLLVFFSVKNGLEKGNNLFRLSDANFLFTSPIKPQLILMYGFIKLIFTSLIFIPILIVQIPTLNKVFPIIKYGWIIIVGNFLLLTIFNSVLSLFVYSIGSLKENYNKIMKRILYGVTTLFILALVYNIVLTGDIQASIIQYMNLRLFGYIPIIGWITNIFDAAIIGYNYMTLVYFLLTLFTISLGIFIIYNLNLDYYENAMENSITKEEIMSRAKSGKGQVSQSNSKVRKINGAFKYSGAKAIFSKQMLEARKVGFIFIDKNTLIYSTFSIIYAYFMRSNGVNFLLYMLAYMNLLFSQAGPWSLELKNHYIYLIPESSVKKIIYATSVEIIKSFITGLIIFGVSSFIYDISILQSLILAITFTSIIGVILYSNIIIRRLLGNIGSLTVATFLRFIITIIFIVPGIILSVVWGMGHEGFVGIYGTYIILIIYNVFASLVLIYFSKGIFEKLELR